MKITIKKLTTAATLLFSLGVLTANAQVTPNTPDVELFCTGSTLNLGAAPANTEWIVRYSTDAGDETPGTTLTLTGGTTIESTDLVNGYYYISTVGDAGHPEICESEWVEVPVYVFEPLTIEFSAEDYCIEDAANQEFTINITESDEFETYAYQWYTVVEGVETPIADETGATYKPDVSITPETTTTYRVKVGYLVGGLAYCSTNDSDDVTVLEKPGTPTIIITGGATGETL